MATYSGTFDAVLPRIQATIYGTRRGVIGTDTSNSLDGRQNTGTAIVEFDPPDVTGPIPALPPGRVDKAIAFPYPTVTDGRPFWDQADYVTVTQAVGRYRILVGGKNVTSFRAELESDQPNDLPGYEIIDPFGYGASDQLFIRRIAGYFERPGHGDLKWLHENAAVEYQRRVGSTWKRDYFGVVIGIKPAPNGFFLEVAGEVSGRAALIERPAPPRRRVADLGYWMWLALGQTHKFIYPAKGPTVGAKIPDGGGMKLDAWMLDLCTQAQDRQGRRWTVLPRVWGQHGRYEFRPRALTSDDGDADITLFPDGSDRIVLDLYRDAAGQPNTWFGSGISPDGTRWGNKVFPGYIQGNPAPYPMSGGADITIGTTDAETIHGDGITVMWFRLVSMGFLSFRDRFNGVYDQDIADAVEDLQDKAGLTSDGVMTTDTWAALWDLSQTGYHPGARVDPLVQDTHVREWNETSSGAYASRNPNYDSHRLRVDRDIDFGSGVSKARARNWIRGEHHRTSGKNWVGTITLDIGVAAWAGKINDEDIAGLTSADLVPGAEIKVDWNLWLPHFDNGTMFHISRARVDQNRTKVTLTVDTQARDFLELKALIERYREAHRSQRREWYASQRATKPTGNLVIRDEHFGILPVDVALDANRWNVLPVLVGQQGQVNQVRLTTVNRKAEFCVVITSYRVTRDGLQWVLGNPFPVDDTTGETCWDTAKAQRFFKSQERKPLYSSGNEKQPCGYGRRVKFGDSGARTSAPLTGVHVDEDPFPYITASEADPVIWLAIYPDRSCTLKAGQVLWSQEDDVT